MKTLLRPLAALALAIAFLSAAKAKAGILQGPVTNPANGHTYYLLTQNTWTASETEAVSLGGTLVTINDVAENEWVRTTFSNSGARSLWIGLNDRRLEGDFEWAADNGGQYVNWDSDEPNNWGDEDFVHMMATGLWNDTKDANIVGSLPAHGVVEVLPTLDLFPTIAPRPADLIAWWPLDGLGVEVVANRDAETEAGAGYASGIVSKSLALDGSQWAAAADSPAWAFGGGDFTIELWAVFGSTGETQALVASDQGSGNQAKWIFWYNGGLLQFHIDTGTESADLGTGTFTPAPGLWHHLAVTRSGQTLTFYVNGGVSSVATSSLPAPDANGPLTFGMAENNYFLRGRLDEVMVYQRALDAGELQAAFAAGPAGRMFAADPAPVIVRHPANVAAYRDSPASMAAH